MARKGLVVMFKFSSLELATNKFCESNLLGVGGFGFVYKTNSKVVYLTQLKGWKFAVLIVRENLR